MSFRDSDFRGRVRVPTLQQIFAGPFANACRRIARWRKLGWLGAPMREHRQRSLRFETLEPRLLLSADLAHTAAAGEALDATLKVDELEGAAILRLVDNASGAVLGEVAADDDVNVTLLGGELSDRLVIGFDKAALAHQVHVTFDGGAGDDEIRGADHAGHWQLGAGGSGSIDDDVAFTGLEKVIGGAGDDTFVVLDPSSTS